MHSRSSLRLPDVFQVSSSSSRCIPDLLCLFLMHFRSPLRLPDAFQISSASSWCIMNLLCVFLVHSSSPLRLPDAFQITSASSWCSGFSMCRPDAFQFSAFSYIIYSSSLHFPNMYIPDPSSSSWYSRPRLRFSICPLYTPDLLFVSSFFLKFSRSPLRVFCLPYIPDLLCVFSVSSWYILDLLCVSSFCSLLWLAWRLS